MFACKGGIVAGVVSDMTSCRALTCIVMMMIAVPMVHGIYSAACVLIGSLIKRIVKGSEKKQHELNPQIADNMRNIYSRKIMVAQAQ